MIEPDLKYCPQCDDEYMPQIVQCAVCEVELITGQMKINMMEEHKKKMASSMQELSPDDDIVSLRKGPLGEMKHLGSRLNSAMIATLIAGDENSCGKGCCSSFFIQVRRQDAEEAMAVLEEEFRQTTGLGQHDISHVDNVFDTSAAEANCPACGHTFSTTNTACPDCGLSLG